ncbi:hypothetical protein [Pseudonocardia sp. D17]|uniref:hypothetical protein n=1 Tax=Pseudonocardia sp. D17 TaxID=882661 RepID=UPI0030D46133|nr:hypothetical protein PSD17_44700 [Pseudonocardia sp. D17]
MSTHTTHQHHRPDDQPPVADRVTAALDELTARFSAVASERPDSDLAHAVRADRLAMVCARRAAWWQLLMARRHRAGMSMLFTRAVIHAANQEQDRARFWRDAATDWRARAERRPTSDAAGAMSNHHDLGIAS